MNQEEILKALHDCGMEDKEARVYLALLMGGKGKASEIAKRSHISRMDAYTALKKLQNRGVVEATMDKPMSFLPVAVDKALDIFIQAKQKEISQIEANQEKLSQYVRLTRVEQVPEFRYQVLKGRKYIRIQLEDLVERAEQEILLLTTSEGLVRLKAAGIMEALKKKQRQGLFVRVLTDVTETNRRQIKEVMEGLNLRHYPLPSYHMLIVDSKELLHSISVQEKRGSSGTEDIVIAMNSPDFIRAQKLFLEALWVQAQEVHQRLQELEGFTEVQELESSEVREIAMAALPSL